MDGDCIGPASSGLRGRWYEFEAVEDHSVGRQLLGSAVGEQLVLDDGRMQRLPDLHRFAAAHGLPLVSIADLIHHRRTTELVGALKAGS